MVLADRPTTSRWDALTGRTLLSGQTDPRSQEPRPTLRPQDTLAGANRIRSQTSVQPSTLRGPSPARITKVNTRIAFVLPWPPSGDRFGDASIAPVAGTSRVLQPRKDSPARARPRDGFGRRRTRRPVPMPDARLASTAIVSSAGQPTTALTRSSRAPTTRWRDPICPNSPTRWPRAGVGLVAALVHERARRRAGHRRCWANGAASRNEP